MKVLREGHRYELENFEDKSKPGQIIQFIEKVPVFAPKLNDAGITEPLVPTGKFQTLFDGTTNEDMIKVLIDRITYLNGKFPCQENEIAITKLDEALLSLEKRTRDRVARNVEGKNLA